MDDRIRRQVYAAIYGFPSLNKYAIDPAQPIRITVVNGNVTLNGVVISQADKDTGGHSSQQCSRCFQGDQQPSGRQLVERKVAFASNTAKWVAQSESETWATHSIVTGTRWPPNYT